MICSPFTEVSHLVFRNEYLRVAPVNATGPDKRNGLLKFQFSNPLQQANQG